MQTRSQQNLGIQSDTQFNKPSTTAGNRFMAAQKTTSTPPPSKLSAKQPFKEMGANTSDPGSYTKFRSNDGDSFDLNVFNIDPNIGDWRAIRTALSTAFSEHVNVRGVWVSVAGDGSVTATVRLNCKDEAHYAVAQLHRRKIGNKRIFISFEQGDSVDHGTLKNEVASLLQDVPNHTLPLFKFREMFEKRYKRSVSSSDLYRMKDVAVISDNSPNGSVVSTPSSGRNISLASNWQSKEGKGVNLYCKFHPPKTHRSTEKSRMGWAKKEAEVMLPNVVIEIKSLGMRIHTLLQSHNGTFPLISFMDCYESEFGKLEIAEEGRGVPLEHLITCVQGVEIVFGDNGMKRVQWHEKNESDHINTVPQPLATQRAHLGRELIDLLKTFPKCTLPFSRLIPCYHAHFGRQCRVADYGHFSLVVLLQTLPNVVQIMGAAQNRVLTLSHRAQMKRFTTDMLRVLKSQGGPKKQILMEQFPSAFSNVFPQRQFQPEDYGLCFFSDLVTELVEHSTLFAIVTDEEGQCWLAVPKREQTAHEIQRTRLFAAEAVELLRHSTRCELEFSKFIPYYHHHFQKQCRVSDYGFGKLAELFDAINDTVVIVNPPGCGNDVIAEDKIIRLTPKEQIKVVGEQICNIIEKRKKEGLPTKPEDLEEYFLEEHGFYLRPELCGASSLDALIRNTLESFVKVIDGEIVSVDRVHIEDLSQKVENILQHAPDYTMGIEELISTLSEKCSGPVNETTIEKDLSHVVVVGKGKDGKAERVVGLAPLRVFAHEMTLLLESNDGAIPLSNLEKAYLAKFDRPLRPAQLGYPTALPMLQAIPDILSVQGKQRTKRVVLLSSIKSVTESTSDDSSSTYERQTPRRGHVDHWKCKENRYQNSGSPFRNGKYCDGIASRRQRSVLPPPLFSPLASPAFAPTHAEVFTFDGSAPLAQPMYDMRVPESVAPGSPPISPPVVWTCHPIFYPSSPNATGPGNILVTSPYVTPTPWSPPPMNSNCYEHIPAQQSSTMLGNEYLFGQNPGLAATFEKLGISVNDGNEHEA